MPLDDTDDEFSNVDPGESRPLLQQGVYPARWICKEIRSSPWGEKLTMHWRVCNMVDFDSAAAETTGTLVASYYNVKRDKAERPKFGPLHSYRKDWIAANNGRLPSRPSSLPLSVFKDRWLFVEVKTVKKDHKGELTHPVIGPRCTELSGPLKPMNAFRRCPWISRRYYLAKILNHWVEGREGEREEVKTRVLV